MPEIARLIEVSNCYELEFVEREATPAPAMTLGTQLHTAGLSPLDTVSVLACFGVEHARSTVYSWVQKARLQPRLAKLRTTVRSMKP